MIGPGSQIGSYRLIERLGRGGMGIVYLAEHMALGKHVALKMLRPDTATDPDAVSRFFTEARAVNMIRHEHIVEVNDFGTAQTGEIYYVMELLSGESLYQRTQRKEGFTLSRALHLGVQVADALAASHAVGVVHRDLKPENIFLIERSNDKDYVKVLDFGLAKLMSGEVSLHQTQTGAVMGSPLYMSPEQCVGNPRIDHRTDIYSLGIILFELVTGRVPFEGRNWGELVLMHSSAPFPSVREIRPAIPVIFEQVLAPAVAKPIDDRYPDMASFREALLQLIDSGGEAAAHLRSSRHSALVPGPAFEPFRRGSLPSLMSVNPDQEEATGEARESSPERLPPGELTGEVTGELEPGEVTNAQAVTAHISRPLSHSSDRTMANVHQASTQQISGRRKSDPPSGPRNAQVAGPGLGDALNYTPTPLGRPMATPLSRSSAETPPPGETPALESTRDTAMVRPPTLGGQENRSPGRPWALKAGLGVAALLGVLLGVWQMLTPSSDPTSTPAPPAPPRAPAPAALLDATPAADAAAGPAVAPTPVAPTPPPVRVAPPTPAVKAPVAPPTPAVNVPVAPPTPAPAPKPAVVAPTAPPTPAVKPSAPTVRPTPPRPRKEKVVKKAVRKGKEPTAPSGRNLNEDDDVLDPRRP